MSYEIRKKRSGVRKKTVPERAGYEKRDAATFIIDLKQGIDKLYNSLKKDDRYYIRNSEKLGLEFEVVESKDSLYEFKDLKLDAFKQEGRKTDGNPKKFYDAHWDLLDKEGLEQLFVARKNGETMGGILTLIFQKHVIQHALVNSPKMDLVGTFLTWNTIKWAIKNDLHTFDFAGVDPNPKTKKEKGIYYYASKWGGKLYDYSVYTKIVDRTKFSISSLLKNPSKISRINKIVNQDEL